MVQNKLVIGLGLGIISAVVFASATTGPMMMRYVLFLLTSLPIFLAGLGWGWRTAAIGGISSVGLVAFAGGPMIGLVFGASQVLPAIVLCYLALLNREYQPDPSQPPTTEWYPPGRLVLWSAVMAGGLTLAVLALASGSMDAVQASIRDYITSTLKDGLATAEGRAPLDETQISQLTDMLVALLPAASAVSWMTAMIFNLWLAGRITLASGQLERPWPDIAALDYPPGTALMLIAAILASGASGIAGGAGTGFLGAFFLAYLLAGLAVIHFVTRGHTWRPFALWGLYAALFVVNVWIAVLIALVGLADRPLRLRARAQAAGTPPPQLPRGPD